MAKICNYCGAEMPDSEIFCEKCGFPNTGDSRDVISLKVSAGLYKQRNAKGEEIERLRQLNRHKRLPNEIARSGGSAEFTIAYPSDDIPPEQEDQYLQLLSIANQDRTEELLREALHRIEQQNYTALERLRIIKRCTVFFAALTAISLICAVLIQVVPLLS